MTPEIAFDCLLLSQDLTVLSTMHRILKDFSIATDLCLRPSQATNLLQAGSKDLIVIDWDSEASLVSVQEAWESRGNQKPTVLAVAKENQAVPAGHVVLRKPMTHESGTMAMRAAYSRMVQECRRHMRHAVMTGVVATDDRRRTLPMTVTNLGDGGVGLITKEEISVGTVLSLPLALPGTGRELSIQARVLWTREYGALGCEFVQIPPADLQIMLDWLKQRCRIKKPAISLDSMA